MIKEWPSLWKNYKQGILNEYFALCMEAEGKRGKEYSACITIQRYWRGKLTRMRIATLQRAATKIQAFARGMLARIKVARKVLEQERNERINFFARNATGIQRM